VIVWLWEAGDRYSGVTDDESAAKLAAMERLRRGDAARVESAVWTMGAGPVGSYILVGEGWRTIRPWHGPMTWEQIVVTVPATIGGPS
jgi:hypothetical protein